MNLRPTVASLALLLTVVPPAAAQPQRAGAAVVLVPGAGGAVPRDFLVRNQQSFAAAGLATAIATSASEAASSASSFASQGMSVTLVGMSAGTPTVAEAVAAGAPASRVVLVSGTLMPGNAQRSVAQSLGTPARLPATLVVHNRQDACPLTPPEAVQRFLQWSGGRARVRWVASADGPGHPCGPMSAHGFYGNDAQAVGTIISFARGR